MGIEHKLNEKQGHWILARLGKKVLRPGGRELTEILIKNMHINHSDDVVEFAPGLGFTASLACAKKPNSYTGVDNNEEAAALAKKNVNYSKMNIIVADASETTLPDACASKVYGEAMLTMQPMEHKKAIIREAARILKPGGFYGIHELGLQPDHISEDIKQSVYKDLSANIRVHARPLTVAEWSGLLKEEGFKIITVHTNAMALLEPKRVLQDEGILRTLKIGLNVLIHGDLRKRVFQMRRTFRKHKDDINAVAIVAQKQ
ncbi:MAG: methyltransferase domain-containing protein [Chitinophagaceae bacterium]|nr:methyltransferase domain-containing protein [Chitinophagaceae bacterium]